MNETPVSVYGTKQLLSQLDKTLQSRLIRIREIKDFLSETRMKKET